MFGFLKEMVAAVKEGMDEAREEMAEDKAAEEERTAAERAARAAALAAQVAATASEETFAVGLGAVYRETFLGELAAAADQQRTPAYLLMCDLPPEEIESVGKLLRRDFDALDPVSVVGAAATLEQQLGRDEDDDALLIARGTWLVTAAAGADLLHRDQVLELTQPFALRAAGTYPSWAEYGRRFLAGERRAPGSNPLGRRALAKTVDTLVQTPGSPWHDRPWPGRPDTDGPTA